MDNLRLRHLPARLRAPAPRARRIERGEPVSGKLVTARPEPTPEERRRPALGVYGGRLDRLTRMLAAHLFGDRR